MIEVKLLGVPQLLARLRKVTDAHDLKLAFGAVGRELVKLEKKRIASQQQLDGSRFPERKSRKGRPEMIANILGRKGKRRQVKMKVSHNGVVIEAFNPLAKAIHHGTPQYKRLKTPAQIRQLTPGIPSHKRACTDEQAKAIKHQIGLSKTIQGIKAMFNELQAELGNEQMVDLVVTIATYCAVVRILASLAIEVEPEYQPYLEMFPLPED